MMIWIFNELVNLMHVEQIRIDDAEKGKREIIIYFASGRVAKGSTTTDTDEFDQFREWLTTQTTDANQMYPGDGKLEDVPFLNGMPVLLDEIMKEKMGPQRRPK